MYQGDSPERYFFYLFRNYPEYHQDYCDWCGWWGYFDCEEVPAKYKLIDCDRNGLDGVLCTRCYDLAEPPWRPNNRDRWHEWLLQVFRTTELNTDVQRTIAEYLAQNDE